MFKTMNFSETLFYQGKRVGLGLFTTYDLKNWFEWYSWALAWSCFENWNSFEKMIKWDELTEILELIEIGLGSEYVYATVIICDWCICFVEVFEHVCFVSGEFLRKWWNLWK